MRLYLGDVLCHRDFQHWRMEIMALGTWCCHVRRLDLLRTFKHVIYQVRREDLEDGSWIRLDSREGVR